MKIIGMLATLAALGRAEKKIGYEGLILCLNVDGRGRVGTFEDLDVFRFNRLDQLEVWLNCPKIEAYYAEGDETQLDGPDAKLKSDGELRKEALDWGRRFESIGKAGEQ